MVKWSPSESPMTKILGVWGPSGFGLGTFLGTLFTMTPHPLFHTLSHLDVISSTTHAVFLLFQWVVFLNYFHHYFFLPPKSPV